MKQLTAITLLLLQLGCFGIHLNPFQRQRIELTAQTILTAANKAVDTWQRELLRRNSLPPDDPLYITFEQGRRQKPALDRINAVLDRANSYADLYEQGADVEVLMAAAVFEAAQAIVSEGMFEKMDVLGIEVGQDRVTIIKQAAMQGGKRR